MPSLKEILKEVTAQIKISRDMPEDFDEIQLTPEQIEAAIFNERIRLYVEAKDIQKKKLKQLDYEFARRPFTAEELKEYVLKKNPTFKVDEVVRPLFDLLCFYFTNDSRFESAGYSLNKGLALAGVPGCGKTELLKLFQFNKVSGFHLININEINLDCIKEGIERYEFYCGYVPGWNHLQKYFYAQNVGWAFDDIGLEDLVADYGNKAFVFSKIIQNRYANKDKCSFRSMHITTMLTPDQLEAKYGAFIRSRFREMFNYLHYQGEDRRK